MYVCMVCVCVCECVYVCMVCVCMCVGILEFCTHLGFVDSARLTSKPQCPLISASLLMFLDAIPGQIPKILAQNGTATPYSEAGRGGSIPTRIPMPRVAQPFLVHRG